MAIHVGLRGARCPRWKLVLLVAALLAPASSALAAVADELKALVDTHQSERAYLLGVSHPEEMGQADFDFFFGIAAIDANHAGEGVLALERYVLQDPHNAVARAHLARGYFLLGDDTRARQEFEELKRQKLPDEIASLVDRYLDILRDRESSYRTVASGFIEAGVGYDSNTNSGASSAALSVPVFGTVTLAPSGVKIPSWYESVTGGVDVSTPVAPQSTLFVGASLDSKTNDRSVATAYDILTYGVHAGATYSRDPELYRVTLSSSELELDGARYLDLNSIGFDVTHQLDATQALVAALQYAHLRYPTQSVRDSDFPTLDLSYRRSFPGPWTPALTAGVTYGDERDSAASNLARHLWGLHLVGSVAPAAKWLCSIGVNYQQSDYQGPEPLLEVVRRDHFASLDLIGAYQWSRAFSIRSELLISSNHSNISLYAYDRDVLLVKARYEFH